MSSISSSLTGQPQPAWDIARLFPPQGHWTEETYLSFTESLNQLVELVDGYVEVLEMPSKSHQKAVQYLLTRLLTFLTDRSLGEAIAAPYRVHLRDQTFREPDIVAYLAEHLTRFGERYGEGADLVMEVVSDDTASRTRDYEDKRRDYAQAGIAEYWIVDLAEERILVLELDGKKYRVLGEFLPGGVAYSKLLEDFCIDVTRLMHACR